MRVVVQRVSEARVEIEGRVTGSINTGFLVLAGFAADDEERDLDWMAGKIVRLRLFSDGDNVMNHSLLESGGGLLVVSQFTLFASIRKGNRPSWSRAAPGALSRPLFERFVVRLQELLGRPVRTGVFGADMQVFSCNDGPVTLFIDSRNPE